jgi:hypothetical protein
VLATGDIKIVYNTGILTGFVRCNGRTIGSATSGATERANADTSSLFSFLWSADPNLAVSGGRGASAAADYAANKTITLPDCRSRSLAGLDDMGNSPALRLTSSYFGATATTLGAVGGAENVTMALANLIQHTHANTLTDPGHTHSVPGNWYNSSFAGNLAGGGGAGTSTISINPSTTGITINNAAAGSASPTPMRTVQPTILATIYIKL